MNLETKAVQKLNEIDEVLFSTWKEIKSIGLLDGLSGIVLYFGQRYIHTNDDKYHSYINEILIKTFDIINEGYTYYSYCTGLSGWAWTVTYLSNNNIIDIDVNETLQEIDLYLMEKSLELIKKNDFDFLHGGIGIVWYLIHSSNAANYKEFFIQIKNLLFKNAKTIDDMFFWQKGNERIDDVNISLSHGTSSIVIILAKIYSIFPDTEFAINIKKSCDFFIKIKQNAITIGSYYPYIYSINHKENFSRLAWCYGDFCIATALYYVGEILSEESYLLFSKEIVDFSLNRIDKKNNSLYDSTVCHGTSGIAEIYYNFYLKTANDSYKLKHQYWIEDCLSNDLFTDGYAGYKQYAHTHGWKNELGIIEGVAGIGLVLQSFLSQNKTNWQSSILLN